MRLKAAPAVQYNTNLFFSPTNLLTTNLMAGANISIVPTNDGKGWRYMIVGVSGSSDAGGTNARQWGSLTLTNFATLGITQFVADVGIAIGTNNGKLWFTNTLNTNAFQPASNNLTNWSNIPTGSMANVVSTTFLTNWANAISNYTTAVTNSPQVTNWINFRQPASGNLSNWSNIPTGEMANVVSTTFLTNWANAISNYVTASTNSPQVTNWINFRQPATANLTNWSALSTGVLYNAAGNAGNIQFKEGVYLDGTNDFLFDRTNRTIRGSSTISLSYSGTPPSNSIAHFTGSTNDYLQVNIKNSSTGTGAESGYAATADNGTETSGFGWWGINSSTFSAVRAYSLGGANDVVMIGSGNDMEIGNANTNRDIIWYMGTAGTPFWTERMRLKSTTQGGSLGLKAGLSSSNSWVAGKILDVRGLTFTNNSAVMALTNAYTNATAIAANMLTNSGDSVICEWGICLRSASVTTNVFQVVYGSQIIFNSGLAAHSNGLCVVRQRITRTSSGTAQECEGMVLPWIPQAGGIGATNCFSSSQSNWIDTPIGLRFSSSRPQSMTNVSFRMYYEPATQ